MKELAVLCVAESTAKKEDLSQLWDRLSDAWDIISMTWYIMTPSDDYQPWRGEQGSEEKQKRFEKAGGILWHRHDPAKSFYNGFDDPNSFACNRDELTQVIADYLSRRYVRHPYLDWIFLDITVSAEIDGFGDSLKRTHLKGKRDRLLGIHHAYFDRKGNFAQMSKPVWEGMLN